MTGSRPEPTVTYVANRFEADWAVPPGSLIKAELGAYEFSQSDVAARTNISTKHFNQMINGHVALSPEIAVSLERVLDIPAEVLLQMDATYQAGKVRHTATTTLAELHRWLVKFPSAILRKYKIVDSAASTAEHAEALLRFFRVATRII